MYWHFRICSPYIALVNFGFQETGHSLSPKNVTVWLREPCTIINWRLLILFFLEIHFLRLKGSFKDFLAIFQNNFCDFWDIHDLRPTYHFRLFFPTMMIEIRTFQLRSFFKFLSIFRGPMKWDWCYWYNHGMWPIILLVFS